MRLPVDKWIKNLAFNISAPSGRARLPNHVSLDISRKCNLRCNMCYYYGEEKADEGSHRFRELSAQEIVTLIIDRLPNKTNYDITGGEPFIRPDLLQILDAIRKRGGGSFVTTNGNLITKEIAARIVGEELLDWASVSVHGIETSHDAITRVPGSFKRSLKGIEYLLEERAKAGTKRPGVSIACTISLSNMDEVGGLVSLMESTGVAYVSFGHASFITPEIKEEHQKVLKSLGLELEPAYDELLDAPPQVAVSTDKLEHYIRTLTEARKKHGDRIGTSPKRYGEEDIRRHFTDLSWKYKPACTYPWRNLRIGPDGTITPCIGYVIGNVRDQDIRKLWNNQRFRAFRSALYRQGLFPGCIRCCKLK